jgi:integrase
MASVHKLRNAQGDISPYYYCSYRTADGRWRWRSTKATGKREAERICFGWQEAETLVEKDEISQERILDLYNETLKRVGLAEIETFTISAWLKSWLEGRKGISEATQIAYQQAVDEFLRFLGAGRNRKLDSIHEKDINAFVDHLLKSGRSPGTVTKLVRKYLNGAFEKARKTGKIRYNPIAATDPLQHDGIVKQTFQPEQVAELVAAAGPNSDWAGMILFAYGSGARLQDVANLRSSNLDIENGVASFVERKGKRIKKKPVVVGLHSDFIDWLAVRPTSDDPSAYVFPSLANKSGAGRNGLSKAFERLMDKAGIQSPVLKTGSGSRGRNVRALSFHSFRHGAASAVFNSEAIKELQRRVTQHSSRSGVLERYTHADLDVIKQAVAGIPRLPKE